jgi:preprotein translocase subunit SecB
MKALYEPMTSPLQLDRYFLKGLNFKLKDGFDRRRVSPDNFSTPQLEIGVVSAERVEEQPLSWRFEVSVELPDSPECVFPYQVETILVGYFTVSEHYPTEHAERLARVNGPAVLYSCAREIVASVTGRCPYPKLLIPSVTFIQPGDIVESAPELTAGAGPKQLTEGHKDPDVAQV